MSQPIGNFILTALDHYIKEKLKVKCYHRHCDDAVFLVKTKSEARHLIKEMDKESAKLGLVVKSSSFISTIQTKKYGKKRRKRQRGGKKNRLARLSI